VPLSLDRHDGGGAMHIHLTGEIDLTTRAELAAELEAAFDRPGVTGVVVDLGGVAFMDCYGMSALIHGRVIADKRSVAFQVRNATGVVHTVMRLTGVLEYLSGE
jgi:anti-anti-sigma factor